MKNPLPRGRGFLYGARRAVKSVVRKIGVRKSQAREKSGIGKIRRARGKKFKTILKLIYNSKQYELHLPIIIKGILMAFANKN